MPDQLDQERPDPGDGALEENDTESPAAAQFPADGGDGCHTGGIQEAEYQQGDSGEGSHDGMNSALGFE